MAGPASTVWAWPTPPTRSEVTPPQPAKRPKASYLRFQAEMPNDTWQSGFTTTG